MKKVIIVSSLILGFLFSCKKSTSIKSVVIADGTNAPVLPAQSYEYSDKISGSNSSNDIVTLGRVLFYDKNLSFSNSISCGTCHIQTKGFADNIQFHQGVYGNLLKRNTLAISGDGTDMFWDGRSRDIMDLALKPIANHDEMLQDLAKLSDKLNNIDYYKKLTFNAFGDETLNLEKINTAIATFCKTLSPTNTKFKESISATSFVNGQATTIASFTESENNGWNIFSGKGRCSACHNVFGGNFYSPSFHNNGLDVTYTDNGLSKITNLKTDDGVFKTPNLANVALTAPYMHDGRFKTLEDVVNFYNSGVQSHTNLDFVLRDISVAEFDSLDEIFSNSPGISIDENQVLSNLIKNRGPIRLNLSSKEKADLVNFMKTLTDNSLIADTRFSNPFRK